MTPQIWHSLHGDNGVAAVRTLQGLRRRSALHHQHLRPAAALRRVSQRHFLQLQSVSLSVPAKLGPKSQTTDFLLFHHITLNIRTTVWKVFVPLRSQRMSLPVGAGGSNRFSFLRYRFSNSNQQNQD